MRVFTTAGIAIILAIEAQAQLINGDFEEPAFGPGSFVVYEAGSYVPGPTPDKRGWLISGGDFYIYRLATGDNELWRSLYPDAKVLEGYQSGAFPYSTVSISQTVTFEQPGTLTKLTFTTASLTKPASWFMNFYAVQYEIPEWGVAGAFLFNRVDENNEIEIHETSIDLAKEVEAGDQITVTITAMTDSIAIDDVNLLYTPIPEPHLYALAVGLGLMAFAGYRRWRRA